MNNPKSNQILSELPDREYQRFKGCLEPVLLVYDEILSKPDRQTESCYFPTQAIVSLVSVMQNGATTEIGLIGKEGMVGTLEFLGNGTSNSRKIVQMGGTAMRVDVEALQTEYRRGETLSKLLHGYSLMLFNQVSQCAACNNHHSVKQRTARWLLMLEDRCDRQTLLMTQKLLSTMLGVRRTGVTEVAKEIQRQGIIEYHRGKIQILDREALEQIACECYQVLKISRQ